MAWLAKADECATKYKHWGQLDLLTLTERKRGNEASKSMRATRAEVDGLYKAARKKYSGEDSEPDVP